MKILKDFDWACYSAHGKRASSLSCLHYKRLRVLIQVIIMRIVCLSSIILVIPRSHNVTVSKLRIEGCKRDSNRGVIDMQSSNYQVLDSVQCVRNENAAGPSCISAWNTTSTIKGMHALDNIGGVGGVLHMGYSTVIIHHGKFTGNKANYSGGAAYFRSCKLKVHDTLFNGNEASEGGGALAIQVLGVLDTRFMLVNTRQSMPFEDCSYFLFLQDGGSANIAQSKFTENLAKGSGGAIAFLTVANYGTSIVVRIIYPQC